MKMKMNKIIIASAIVSSVIFSGCATLFGGGGKQYIAVNSDKPMKATFAYSDGSSPQYFTTPATLSVERKSQDVNITSATKEFNQVNIKKSVNGWFFVNILGVPYGLPFSSTTDAATGSMWTYDDAIMLQSK